MKLKFYLNILIILLLINYNCYGMSEIMEKMIEKQFLIAVANDNLGEMPKIKKGYKLGNTFINDSLILYSGSDTSKERYQKALEDPRIETRGIGTLIKKEILELLNGIKVSKDIYKAAENKLNKKKNIEDNILTKFQNHMKALTLKAVQYLLRVGADINYKNQSGETALMAAVKMGNTEIVEFLISVPEVDLKAKNKSGESAKDLASIPEIKKLITDKLEELRKPKEPVIPPVKPKEPEIGSEINLEKLKNLLAQLDLELNQLGKKL